ncbi:dihydroneopterin triphosphate diphosphatase [Variovorax saccharolyticus]|uniref:dihydroneopterin triphosphate diphosphatase n=1 Tax=Variovorax saccharolyticus TaxID=3053516 RepID=UPI002576391C|nr:MULTISPECIES: dihydroneopterin triphosphate diphosphatase [unclassified Variovorax]MDM0015969.1 dihydroneopterin triphosphate diphosphatase [Variovorax sp. J22R187]MDM0025009.1 dihydroneopterin triphosphate diphosphatase [Variovorax sp. J31P216]
MTDGHRFKIPESVLVVIHTPALEVLLIRRTGDEHLWQSVTGSKDREDEPLPITAAREVEEETGILCGPGNELAAELVDWQRRNVFPIRPRWRARYAPGVSSNTEHVFGLRVPGRLTPRLDPCEHTAWQWLPYQDAAALTFSSTNAAAILLLPQFAR